MSGGQYGEDALLGLFFRGVETGLVVDVGAADGEVNSNSWMLLKRPEWKGMLIEPLPSAFLLLKKRYENRPGVTCVNCAIGEEEGLRTMFCCGQVSTLKLEVKKSAEEMHKVKYSTAQVLVRNLTKVLIECGVKEEIDFLSIDTEGMDWEVWETLDKTIFHPKLVCMEGYGYCMNGYYEFCRVGGNTFYLREDIEDIYKGVHQ